MNPLLHTYFHFYSSQYIQCFLTMHTFKGNPNLTHSIHSTTCPGRAWFFFLFAPNEWRQSICTSSFFYTPPSSTYRTHRFLQIKCAARYRVWLGKWVLGLCFMSLALRYRLPTLRGPLPAQHTRQQPFVKCGKHTESIVRQTTNERMNGENVKWNGKRPKINNTNTVFHPSTNGSAELWLKWFHHGEKRDEAAAAAALPIGGVATTGCDEKG